ncbi:MAG: TlpA disulfide reductase family protein [Ferruginibacter sp.]
MGKKILFILSVFISANAFSQVNGEAEPPHISMDSLFKIKEKESIGKLFPQFNSTFNGRIITKDSLRGKVVFINFWFAACPPCIAEMSALNELYKKFSSNKNFEFISFTYESPARIILLKKKYSIKYKVASVTRQECYRLNQNNGFPTSIVLDREGVIHDLFTGGDIEDKKEAKDFIISMVYKSINGAIMKQ